MSSSEKRGRPRRTWDEEIMNYLLKREVNWEIGRDGRRFIEARETKLNEENVKIP